MIGLHNKYSLQMSFMNLTTTAKYSQSQVSFDYYDESLNFHKTGSTQLTVTGYP